jgi:hypothetical protein
MAVSDLQSETTGQDSHPGYHNYISGSFHWILFFRLWKYFHRQKNRIHIGSQQAGPKVAAILSIVKSCRHMKVPGRDYLAAVLPDLAADTSIQRLAELKPTAWAARNR